MRKAVILENQEELGLTPPIALIDKTSVQLAREERIVVTPKNRVMQRKSR